MRVKITTFKPSGKYYSEEPEVKVPVAWPWEMGTWMWREIREGRIPGLVEGAKDFHVLVEDLDTGIPYLFALDQKEIM